MPKQGQSVESCIIVEWKKQVGEAVAEGDVLCDVETDKATLEVEATATGVVLAHIAAAGDEVPVLAPIAVIGNPGEVVEAQSAPASAPAEAEVASPVPQSPSQPVNQSAASAFAPSSAAISPRARHAAERKGVETSALQGSGPGGRVIERDVLAAAAQQPKLTPVAKAMVADGGFAVPQQGSGPGGRVTSRDLVQQGAQPVAEAPSHTLTQSPSQPDGPDEITQIPVKGIRKVIAERMLASLQTTAQLTMHASADARALQAYRKRLKESPEALGLRGITINDLVLFATARALMQHPDVNAHFAEMMIAQHRRVHLGFAVDTARGLMVPVIRDAHTLSLRSLAAESKRLATAALEGKSAPDDLTGGTFTVTNLGGFGVESFTPVLNPPQVAILGVSNIQIKPVQGASGVEFVPHLGLSLTINHQVVDGAPGARFLQTLAGLIANFDLLLAD
jgi:pyruvate dehydrogenase E2 component (dihydrolipoamide acetyltransferase)